MKRIMCAINLLVILSPGVSFAQRVLVEQGMAVIDCTVASGMPQGAVERHDGQFVKNGRVERHTDQSFENYFVSEKFAVGKTYVRVNGSAESAGGVGMTWAEAAGWHKDANTTNSEVKANTGCPMYQGYNGTDVRGAWRLPTQRELMLMWIFRPALEKLAGIAPFEFYNSQVEWCATESEVGKAWGVIFGFNYDQGGATSRKDKTSPGVVRCVRDLF